MQGAKRYLLGHFGHFRRLGRRQHIGSNLGGHFGHFGHIDANRFSQIGQSLGHIGFRIGQPCRRPLVRIDDGLGAVGIDLLESLGHFGGPPLGIDAAIEGYPCRPILGQQGGPDQRKQERKRSGGGPLGFLVRNCRQSARYPQGLNLLSERYPRQSCQIDAKGSQNPRLMWRSSFAPGLQVLLRCFLAILETCQYCHTGAKRVLG